MIETLPQLLKPSLGSLAFDIHHHVAWRLNIHLILTEDLTQPSLDSISDYRLPDLFGNGDAEAAVRKAVGAKKEHEKRSVDPVRVAVEA
ncbi:MAG TPA: hypothetical protein VLV83_00245 [Acidobacteriota bacterium]|nr:hypothetical protein [Acidobacteriota bacterium]